MTRKIVSTTLLVSLLALGSSGAMMLILNSYEFQLRMHPVHKLFGIAMIISGSLHVFYNFKAIKKYLESGKILLYGIVMTLFMILLYFAGFNKPLDADIIKEIETTSRRLESKNAE